MPSSLEKYLTSPEAFVDRLQNLSTKDWWKIVLVFMGGVALFLFYMWIYMHVLGFDLPKTAILKRRNEDLRARVTRISQNMDRQEEILSLLEVRDDKIYRSVYGLDEIPSAVRNSGLGGDSRYEPYKGTLMESVKRRQDILEKRAYVQSKSFDDITILQQSAGDMAAHIPAISPVNTDRNTYHMSSPFGYRTDPILGFTKRHTGMDFACPPGNPIYSTGDGVVSAVKHERKGYGNHVEVDHGFGYKTRYAHMSKTFVTVGQQLKRGDCVGLTGKSGRCTGPHLHYEVMYRKDYVNPALYMDLDMSPKDYFELVRKPSEDE